MGLIPLLKTPISFQNMLCASFLKKGGGAPFSIVVFIVLCLLEEFTKPHSPQIYNIVLHPFKSSFKIVTSIDDYNFSIVVLNGAQLNWLVLSLPDVLKVL